MAVKKCCITNCNSCSSRSEDVGVTYHKFPKDLPLFGIWIEVTQLNPNNKDTTNYVCSRHFCKSDFNNYKDSKYVLKSDAVPSIFPWIIKDSKSIKMDTTACEENKELNESKQSDGDNLEEIRKFIENKEIPEMISNKETVKNCDENVSDESGKDFDERLAVASSMMDVIMNETEEQLASKKEGKGMVKNKVHSGEKANNSMALSVGSKVEAKDFGEFWHPAEIIEVDYEEMEVLVHYDNAMKKHDEWINVSSPRLRPLTNSPNSHSPLVSTTSTSRAVHNSAAVPTTRYIKEEPKSEPVDKAKMMFKVGERCLAKWRDSRRFMATINRDLGNGHYEIVFDDGFQWKCTKSRLYKMKQSVKTEGTDDTSSPSSVPPVQYGAGPSSTQPPSPAYHTHLFDPTRDYLSSKSERREMKRKLNIKEIFNIGQKRPKKTDTSDKVVKRKKAVKIEPVEPKTEIPDAVASIIGTKEDSNTIVIKEEVTDNEDVFIDDNGTGDEMLKEVSQSNNDVIEMKDKQADNADLISIEDLDIRTPKRESPFIDSVQEEELLLEKFDKEDGTIHDEVIDRMKEVINKLEDGISRVETPKLEIKEETVAETKTEPEPKAEPVVEKDNSKRLSKVKKSKKLRLLQEKKVKKQVEKVKSELEEMKRQVEEMRKQMLAKTEELAKGPQEMPESFLLPGEWCCKWVNGQPVGKVSELEGGVKDGNCKPGLPRRSVQVEDKRLPPGWTKHMVRRSLGHSAGKWDVVLISPDDRRFHTKTDMRNFLEQNVNESLLAYEHPLMDFGVHLKLSRRMGWVTTTPDGVDNTPVVTLPVGTLASTSPLVKRRKLSLKREHKDKKKKTKLGLNIRMPKYLTGNGKIGKKIETSHASSHPVPPSKCHSRVPPLEEGYVYVGSLKVQVIENLLRCPAEGCYKNFRNNTLIKMHIKHYHRELKKMLGRTPKVLDLAYARTMPTASEPAKAKEPDLKTIKVKIGKPSKRSEDIKPIVKELKLERGEQLDMRTTPTNFEDVLPKMQDSPKLRHALINKPIKRPRVLLPVRRPEPEQQNMEEISVKDEETTPTPFMHLKPLDIFDMETTFTPQAAIKPSDVPKKRDKKIKLPIAPKSSISEDEDWYMMTSDMETRSSFPRSGTPDSKYMDQKMMPVSSESNEDQKDSKVYMYTETGERIKIVHMKREEIINCHCGFREEDGLMVQCELCLCWQHALCHNIQRECDVPEKYTCSICLNPRRGRRSARFIHDQDRMYEGLLPGARPSETLRRSHELTGNLHRIQDALHALKVKYHAALIKNHPKLYLWATDWENGELSLTQERLNSDYSDLNIMISSLGKENLPIKLEDVGSPHIDMQTPPSEEHDRYNQRELQLGSQSLLGGLLTSPGGASLELPISTSELERFAKSVQEEVQRVSAPQPEAAIENGACRERLLRHIQRCQTLIDARMDSIEAQVAELESQNPSFKDDEQATRCPKTKQTIQMLMRDLDTMEELGVLT